MAMAFESRSAPPGVKYRPDSRAVASTLLLWLTLYEMPHRASPMRASAPTPASTGARARDAVD